MKYIFLFLSALVFAGCFYNSILSKETRNKIPSDANQVILSFDISKDSVFVLVSNLLLDETYRIYNSDRQIAFINTDSKYIRNSMNMRLNIRISGTDKTSKLFSNAEWMLDDSSEGARRWYQSSMQLGGYFTYAYENMVLTMEKLPYKEIQFVKN